MTEDEQREKVVEVAKSWLGTPYHHAGRIKGAGADCLTSIAEIYYEAGVDDKIDMPYCPQDWHLHRSEERYLSGLLQYTKEIFTKPKKADIILWKFGRCYSHGTIVIDYPIVIHSYINVGCVLDDVEKAEFLKIVGENVPEQNQMRPYKIFSFWA